HVCWCLSQLPCQDASGSRHGKRFPPDGGVCPPQPEPLRTLTRSTFVEEDDMNGLEGMSLEPRIHFITLGVRYLANAICFYRDGLGFRNILSLSRRIWRRPGSCEPRCVTTD